MFRRKSIKTALLAAAAVVTAFVAWLAWLGNKARKDEQRALQYFHVVVADCRKANIDGLLGGSLIVRECTLPQSVEPLIKMGRDAEPALLRIVEPRRQDTDEQVYEAFLANKCAMLVTSPKVTRWDTKTNAATGMVLVVYAFDTTPKEGWTLDRALRWVKITALRLVGQD